MAILVIYNYYTSKNKKIQIKGKKKSLYCDRERTKLFVSVVPRQSDSDNYK